MRPKRKRTRTGNRASVPAPKMGFLDLPHELRRMVYHLVIPTDFRIYVHRCLHVSPEPLQELAFFSVCKLISAETRYMFYQENSFVIEGEREWLRLRQFLVVIGPSNRLLLRHLRFSMTDGNWEPVYEVTEDETHYRLLNSANKGFPRLQHIPLLDLFKARIYVTETVLLEVSEQLDRFLHRIVKARKVAEFVDPEILDCARLLQHGSELLIDMETNEWDIPIHDTPTGDFIYEWSDDSLPEEHNNAHPRCNLSTALPDLLRNVWSQLPTTSHDKRSIVVHWKFEVPSKMFEERRASIEAAGWLIQTEQCEGPETVPSSTFVTARKMPRKLDIAEIACRFDFKGL